MMKLFAGILIGITTVFISNKTTKPSSKVKPIEPHASIVYQGYRFACDRTDKHKTRHHAVAPKGDDPYFQNLYWD
jgi:hypothetical protein